ncbi:MAG: carboxypeptidase regulatory-like domain-containing protein [Bacteroidota bacterium]
MKNPYQFIKSLVVFSLLCLMAGSALAQVSVSVQIIPPFRYRVTDYASHPEQLLLTLINTSSSEKRVQLRGALTGDNGVELRVKDSFKSRSALVLAAGEVKVLNGSDFNTFFDLSKVNYTGITEAEAIRGNGLPEGNYYLCVRVYDYDSNASLSAAEPAGCSNSFGVTNLEPPVILSPSDGQEFQGSAVQLVTFSWTTPPGASPTVWYRVRMVEILGNGNPNDAMMTAREPIFFEKEVLGNMYVYGPADPQLTSGRRYAMMVTAFDRENALNFRNKGQSVVVGFKYEPSIISQESITDQSQEGMPLSAPPTTNGGNDGNSDYRPSETQVTPPAAYTNPDFVVKGLISFGYLADEEKEEGGALPIIGSAGPGESINYETVKSSGTPTTTFPLSRAHVSIYGRTIDGDQEILLGTGVSGTDGNYNITVSTAKVQSCKPESFYIMVKDEDKQLYPVKQMLPLTSASIVNGSFLTDAGTTVLPIVSMRVKPFVVSRIGYNNSQITINLLLNETKYNASPLMKKAGLGASGQRVNYNNVNYVVLSKFPSGNVYKKLFRSTIADGYLVQVTGLNNTPFYYPLDALAEQSATDTTKSVATITKNFVYNPSKNAVEGIVSFNGSPMVGTRIVATFQDSDISDGSTETMYEAVTDLNGYYKFATLPTLRRTAIITLTVTERRIQEGTGIYTVTAEGVKVLTKNIELKKWMATVVGQAVWEKGSQRFPIPNALVTIRGTNITTRTTNNGIYILKVPLPCKTCKLPIVDITADGYKDTSPIVTYQPWSSGLSIPSGAFTPAQWDGYVQATAALKSFRTYGKVPADSLNIGSGTLTSAFSTFFSPGEEMRLAIEVFTAVMPRVDGGDIKLRFKLDDKLVAAKVWIDGERVKDAVAGEEYHYKGLPRDHTVTVEPISAEVPFLKTTAEFPIINLYYGYLDMTVKLQHAMMITGVVRDSKTGKPLDSALVSVVGLPYKVYTNSQGEYSFSLPNNREYTLSVVRPTYEGASETRVLSSSSQVLDFPIPWIDPSFPTLKTLAGYPVTIKKIVKLSEEHFSISGSLTVASNDLYTIDANNATLTFTDVSIKAAPKDINAIPTADFSFEQAVLPVKILGKGNVEVQGAPFIQLKALREGDYSTAVIGGNQLLLKLSATRNSDNLPVMLPDMVIKDAALLANNFNYVFSTSANPIKELGKDRTFKMHFLDLKQPDYTTLVSFSQPAASGYFGTDVGIMGALYVDKTTATLSNAGYTIDSYYQFPEVAGLSIATTDKKIELEKLVMNPGASPQSITLPVTVARPFTGTMQSFKVVINKMQISGLGSENSSLLMGGKILVLKQSGANDENGVLTIKSLSFVKRAEEDKSTLSAVLKLPQGGLTINSLNFSTPAANNEIGLAYNLNDKSFEIEAAGILKYASSSSSGQFASVLGSVFPIKIDKFRMRSKDWDLYLVASPNIQVDLRVAKLHLSRLLINIGYGMTMKAMNDDLVSTVKKPVTTTAAVEKMEQMDGSSSAWAIGMVGGITFPIDGINTGASASLLVGNVGNGIEVVLNEFDLKLATASFTLAAKVAMKFGEEKQGFEVAAKMTTLSKEFGASFKYYSLAGGDIELGASIQASVNVVTGPIMWHTFGGGFEYLSRFRFYDVRLNGDISPVGVPKRVMYVQSKVGIAFNGVNCGLEPVISGEGNLVMSGRSWGTVNLTADFCKKMLLVVVNSKDDFMPLMPGAGGQTTSAVLYGLAPQGSAQGSFFMALNSNLRIGDLIKGTSIVAFGYNYNNNIPGVPAEAKAMFKLLGARAIDANGIMNAAYIKGQMAVLSEGDDLSLSIEGFKFLESRFNVNASGYIELVYNYGEGVDKPLVAYADLNAKVDVYIRLLGVSLGARALFNFTLNGDYDTPNNEWSMKGDIGTKLEFYSQADAGCNSLAIKMCDPPQWCPCFSWFMGIPYPDGRFNCSCGSGWIPCGYSFKVCTGFSANFNLSSRNGITVKANLFQ